MAKKQKSFADKAAGNASGESVYVKYVKSVQSEETGRWRFNEQMIRMNKGEQLDAALKRMDEAANLIDIDLSEFINEKQTGEDSKESEAKQESSNDKPSNEVAESPKLAEESIQSVSVDGSDSDDKESEEE